MSLILTGGLGEVTTAGTGGAAAPLPLLATPIDPSQWVRHPSGTARRYALVLVDPSTGARLSGVFAPSMPRRVYVWDGRDGSPLASFAASWTDAASAAMEFTITAADLAGLEEQPYPLRVEVDAGQGWQSAFESWLDVTPGDGGAAAAPGRVYCSWRDVRDVAGRAVEGLVADGDPAGLRRDREAAARWLDAIILAHAPARRFDGYGYAGSRVPLTVWGQRSGAGYPTGDGGPDERTAAGVAAGGLAITAELRRAVAHRSAAEAFARSTADGSTGMARHHARGADCELARVPYADVVTGATRTRVRLDRLSLRAD